MGGTGPVAVKSDPKICKLPECGKEFNRKMTLAGVRSKPEGMQHYLNREYCSKDCSNKARALSPQTFVCQNPLCGKTVTGRNTHGKRPREYCNAECRSLGFRTDVNTTFQERRSAESRARREKREAERAARPVRQKYVAFKKTPPLEKPTSVFPEGPRTEVWRPGSWQNQG